MKYANHPRDLNQRAKSIVDLSTGEKQSEPLPAAEPQKKRQARAKTPSPATKRRKQAQPATNLR